MFEKFRAFLPLAAILAVVLFSVFRLAATPAEPVSRGCDYIDGLNVEDRYVLVNTLCMQEDGEYKPIRIYGDDLSVTVPFTAHKQEQEVKYRFPFFTDDLIRSVPYGKTRIFKKSVLYKDGIQIREWTEDTKITVCKGEAGEDGSTRIIYNGRDEYVWTHRTVGDHVIDERENPETERSCSHPSQTTVYDRSYYSATQHKQTVTVKCSVCGTTVSTVTDYASHYDNNSDGKCDACGGEYTGTITLHRTEPVRDT